MPTTIDFDKIFSTNSPSTPFTWTDSDYLEGWSSIQNTPPTRQQFDALQMLSDLKSKYLMDYKAPKHSPVFTGDPQAPTPAKNDDDNSLATTAFVQTWVQDLEGQIDDNGIGIISGSFGQNGYARFKNGWMVQWGATSSSPLVLPTSFPQNTWIVVATHVTYYEKPCLVVFDGNNKTGSGVRYAVYDAENDSWDVGNVIFYVAVGR